MCNNVFVYVFVCILRFYACKCLRDILHDDKGVALGISAKDQSKRSMNVCTSS